MFKLIVYTVLLLTAACAKTDITVAKTAPVCVLISDNRPKTGEMLWQCPNPVTTRPACQLMQYEFVSLLDCDGALVWLNHGWRR